MYRVFNIVLQATGGIYPFFVAAAGLIVFFLSLFIILLVTMSGQKKTRRRLEQQLQEERFEARLLENRLQVQASISDSVGNELHGNIGQLLTTVKMLVGIAEADLSPPSSALVSANETLGRAMTEIRSIVCLLDREWLLSFDLYTELTTIIAEIHAGGRMQVMMKRKQLSLPLSIEKKFTLFIILQEAIKNVVKHADAKRIYIIMQYNRTLLTTSISDDGRGYDMSLPSKGIGLKNMSDRTRGMGGTICFTSDSGGTTVNIELPIEKIFL